MRRLRSWFLRFRWQKLLVVWLVFGLMAAALFAERSGVQYTGTHLRLNLLDTALTKEEAATGETPTCLLLCDSTVDGGDEARAQFEQMLLDMKVPTAVADLAEEEALPAFENYQTVVVLAADLDTLGLRLLDLMDWVEQGGNVLFAMTLEKSGAFDAVAQKLGVLSSSWSNKVAESIVPAAGFMLGGGQRYELSDPFESALGVRLRDDATVYAVTGDEGVPLVWSTELGKGRIVVDNIGVYDKVMRGFYAASYSLLGDACAYPVLNSAVFFLDDFPSPVPEGDGQYIRQQYGLSIAEFYAKVWWPDLVRLAERYGIRYTGVMIENYGDDTEAPPTRQRNIRQFQYYGGLLLRQGGELGFHGYNHQPLVLPETDYGDRYDYRQWPSADAIVAAMDELTSFQKAVLPYASGSVYVPPSNILSASGRAILGSRVPQVRTIASSYLEDGTDRRGRGRRRGGAAHRFGQHGGGYLHAHRCAERVEPSLRQHPLHAPGRPVGRGPGRGGRLGSVQDRAGRLSGVAHRRRTCPADADGDRVRWGHPAVFGPDRPLGEWGRCLDAPPWQLCG